MKREITDGALRLAIPNIFIFSPMPPITVLEPHLYKKNQFGKMELVSANSSLFSTTELRLSTNLCECSSIIYEFLEYEVLMQGSKHPIVLYTDHKTILFLFTQKKPNHRNYKFPLILMKFPNLHIVWTEGKKSFTSRSTQSLTDDNNTR